MKRQTTVKTIHEQLRATLAMQLVSACDFGFVAIHSNGENRMLR